ncbi:hypothetical protein GCM10018785_55420 [Streptomyces longispororuber]|uniref:DUF1266 domain-containing protein n=1 Tax=Streptomyces longispororuber TaxID=68230 RepID=A0A919A193_9ACTN|nr:DUF1266 domain-containing protein [Streptomyces longispororuber]GHE80269.1 hypothetical protein GCM10018785_55420 [Streptomyces longispororuber]
MYAAVEDEYHDDVFPVVPEPEDGVPWQAPADLEEHLYELARADDGYTYLRALAVAGVYRPVPLTDLAARPDAPPLFSVEVPDGRRVAQVYTAGFLPRPHPDLVYEYVTLGTLARSWPDDVDVLVVNARTPCEQYYLTTDEERRVWADLHDDHHREERLGDRVETRRTGAPAPGPLLHGLACGAHLCYANGDPWNTLDWHGAGHSNEVARLEEWWGVRDRAEWLDVQERLLAREVSPWFWDFVLGVRATLPPAPGPVDPELWRRRVEAALRERVAATGGPGAPHRPGDDPELDQFVAALRALVGKVLRYEARFRADGLLPADGYVRTVAAWDVGRASKMARWGRGARYATHAELESALERASQEARAAYASWEEFSAGYVLGRCLHFDEEEFGSWYTTVLRAHRALTTDPDSPWLTVPFR